MAKKKASLPVETCCSPAIDKKRERQYQIEAGLRTMRQAATIVKDKSLLKDIKSFAKDLILNLNKVAK